VGDTTRVGSYPSGASFYGLLDMAGNVAEWVADWYDAYPGNTMINVYYGKFDRVLRGGAWGSYSYFITSSSRAHGDPVGWSKGVGFRCAR
jgi:formylglycine-generating enzyme required for sulfatase activity